MPKFVNILKTKTTCSLVYFKSTNFVLPHLTIGATLSKTQMNQYDVILCDMVLNALLKVTKPLQLISSAF